MRLWGSFLVLIGAVCYGAQAPLVKLAYEHGLTTWQIVLMEYLTASIFFFGIVFVIDRKSLLQLNRIAIIKLFTLAILGPGLTSVFYYLTLALMPASVSVIFLFQYMLFILLFEKIFNKARLRKNQIISIVLIFIGTFFAVELFTDPIGDIHPLGIIFGVLAAFTYAIFIFFTDKTGNISSPWVRSAVISLSITLFVLPLIALMGEGNETASINELIKWGILIGFVGQMIPLIAFNFGVPIIKSQLSSILGAMELPGAIIFSMVLIQENISGMQWIGIVIITIAIVIAEINFTESEGLLEGG